MTVAELIEALRGVSPNLPVVVEGCDCVGDAAGVVVRDDGAMITRPDGVYSALDRWTRRT